MDFRNFETTTTYAIEAVYMEYFNMLPEKYRIKDPIEKKEEEIAETAVDKHPLSYEDVEHLGKKSDGGYFITDDDSPIDLTPFYDPELNFSDRLHYRLTNIDYPKRKNPWFLITWNCGKGLLKSSLTRRRFTTATCEDDDGNQFMFDFINTDLDITMAITSNTMQGLFEVQENIIIGKREKVTVDTRPHTILGKFPVSLDVIDSDITKYARDKGTLCCLMLNIKVDYPVIGNLRSAKGGIIYKIKTEIDRPHGEGPDNHEVLARDIITPDS